MKRIFRIFLGTAMLAAVSVTAGAQESSESPLWMRYSAISPDGSTIAFAYKGEQGARRVRLPPTPRLTPVRYGVPTAPG